MMFRLQLSPAAVVLMALATSLQAADAPTNPTWLTDYGKALSEAESKGRMLLVYFYSPEATDLRAKFEANVLDNGLVKQSLERFVLAKVPADTVIKVEGGQQVKLLEHASFARLGGKPGLAVIETSDSTSFQFRKVVETWAVATDVQHGPTELARWASAIAPVDDIASQSTADKPLTWLDDYSTALEKATAEGKYLLVYFRDTDAARVDRTFEDKVLSDPNIRRRLQRFVLAKVPLDAQIRLEGNKVPLLKHEAFHYMYGRQGFCIVDLANKGEAFYRHVVSAHPFGGQVTYDGFKTATILDLPPGTITQRTMVFAVRTHGEQPQSTHGNLSRLLAAEAESHSAYQAAIDNQGHHNWGHRFQRISAQLGGGMAAQEVCAESWPGQELVDACVECVSSWRQSSGHWEAVRSRHPLFGYDIKLGARAVWYATGIFGRH